MKNKIEVIFFPNKFKSVMNEFNSKWTLTTTPVTCHYRLTKSIKKNSFTTNNKSIGKYLFWHCQEIEKNNLTVGKWKVNLEMHQVV